MSNASFVPFPVTPLDVFRARRRSLAALAPRAFVVAAGTPPARNYPANQYRYRAGSHFLYLVGEPIPRALFASIDGRTTLFVDPPDPDDALWHGARPTLDEVRERHGVDEVRALADAEGALASVRAELATLPPHDTATAAQLSAVVGRAIGEGTGAKLESDQDAALADAMIGLRLVHDVGAQAQLRAAAKASASAHIEGMRASRSARTEAEIMGAMVGVLRRHGMDDAYGPIVTVHGEVLHAHGHGGTVEQGDLLLADVGGESPEGWASDITRTWPVNGRFSPSQRAVYEVVLEANRRAIDRVRTGVRYRDVHETAKRAMVEGLVALGVFKGSVDGLIERGAAGIFFPHGVGHLLGLDVHDMEDLGDRAGYAQGRARSAAFGDRYLRLDRDLAPGMAVTIEPGFYQVPGILSDPAIVGRVGADLDRNALARLSDVRGIRIEDDVLCTAGDPEVMTAMCPKAPDDVEAAVLS